MCTVDYFEEGEIESERTKELSHSYPAYKK
jgi:hypothetical protein